MGTYIGGNEGNLFTGDASDDFMNGGGGDDSLNGSLGNDYLIGGAGRDVVSGGGGDDILQVGAGEVVATELYNGGAGVDTLLISSLSPSSLVVNADFRTSSVYSIEKLSFVGNNNLHMVDFKSSQLGGTGLSSALDVNGGGGRNVIGVTMNSASANLGGWTFANWGTNDGISIKGTAAAETVNGSSQSDYINLGTGMDQIFAGGGNDKIEIGKVTNGSTFDGGAGFDTIFAADDFVDLTQSTVTSIEKITFRGTGDGASHTVAVEADQFNVNGISFQLQLDGMTGDTNTLAVFMANQQSINLNGIKSVDLGADMRLQMIGDDDGELMGGSSMNDLISGNGGNDDLSGYDGADTLVGGTGDDIMRGGNGADTYFIDSAGDQAIEVKLSTDDGAVDTVHVTGFSYTLGELVENLTLHGGNLNGTGNALNNVIKGTDGNNVLKGMLGDDVLVGGKGVDVMYGGAGSDTFVFTDKLDSQPYNGLRDKVMDFKSGIDHIDVSGIDANLSTSGVNEAFTLDTDGGALGIGEYSVAVDGNGNMILSFNNDIGSAPDFQIHLQYVPSLQAGDLIL